MGNELECPRDVAIGNGIQEISLCFTAPHTDDRGYGIFGDLRALGKAGKLVEFSGELVEIAPDRCLKKLDRRLADADAELAGGVVHDPLRESVAGELIELERSRRFRETGIGLRPSGCSNQQQ